MEHKDESSAEFLTTQDSNLTCSFPVKLEVKRSTFQKVYRTRDLMVKSVFESIYSKGTREACFDAWCYRLAFPYQTKSHIVELEVGRALIYSPYWLGSYR